MKFSWNILPHPFFALAPMEDVTDTVFRQIVVSLLPPDVCFTEFTNCDGMQSEGRKAVEHRLKFSPGERPIIAQVWGIHPENYHKTAQDIVGMGFDGIDINMGCPEKSVTGHGACSALINNPSLAREIILATKEGVAGKIPVSVKTRIGYGTIVTDVWIRFLLKTGIDALTVHGRTAAEMSKVPCHWDEIQKAVHIRDELGVPTAIIGNGDVRDARDGLLKVKTFGVDGVMIGRGIFENPWAFDTLHPGVLHAPLELLDVMKRHVELFESTWGTSKHYPILKKFFKIYVRGFTGASDVRTRIMETRNPQEVYPIIESIRQLVQQPTEIRS